MSFWHMLKFKLYNTLLLFSTSLYIYSLQSPSTQPKCFPPGWSQFVCWPTFSRVNKAAEPLMLVYLLSMMYDNWNYRFLGRYFLYAQNIRSLRTVHSFNVGANMLFTKRPQSSEMAASPSPSSATSLFVRFLVKSCFIPVKVQADKIVFRIVSLKTLVYVCLNFSFLVAMIFVFSHFTTPLVTRFSNVEMLSFSLLWLTNIVSIIFPLFLRNDKMLKKYLPSVWTFKLQIS